MPMPCEYLAHVGVPGRTPFRVDSGGAGQALMGFVKREAGVNPALSRSGDGNETLHGVSHALSR